MNRVIRWNPTRELDLFNEFDRMLERTWDAARSGSTIGFGLAVDMVERDESFMLKASLPGVHPDDINITLEDNVLTISGEIHADEVKEDETYHLRERRFGHFTRSFRFPTMVNAEAIEADYDNGILLVTVPKAEEVKPKRITIRANS
jgi:HSP20 family protein